MIPINGVGEVVCGASEVAGEEKIGGKGVEGMFSKDMTEDKMTFEARKMSRATRVITCKVRTEKSVLMRACGEVLSVERVVGWLVFGCLVCLLCLFVVCVCCVCCLLFVVCCLLLLLLLLF